MKKILAIVLALVMAFSMTAIAFADDTATSETAAATEETTGSLISSLGSVDLSDVQSVIDQLFSAFTANGIIDFVKTLISNIESLLTSFAAESDVLGAVADLEAKVGDLGLVGDVLEFIEGLINTLKQKIKDFYAGNKETAIEETTAEAPAETGSSETIGIVAFAAVSVAAAAAYVCTKKKED